MKSSAADYVLQKLSAYTTAADDNDGNLLHLLASLLDSFFRAISIYKPQRLLSSQETFLVSNIKPLQLFLRDGIMEKILVSGDTAGDSCHWAR